MRFFVLLYSKNYKDDPLPCPCGMAALGQANPASAWTSRDNYHAQGHHEQDTLVCIIQSDYKQYKGLCKFIFNRAIATQKLNAYRCKKTNQKVYFFMPCMRRPKYAKHFATKCCSIFAVAVHNGS